MKNSFIIICLLGIFNFNLVLSEELKLNSNSIKLDKNNNSISLNGNVNVSDNFGNSVSTDQAIYNKNLETLKTIGETELETKNKYLVKSKNILFDNVQGLVRSSFPSTIIDIDGNQIQVPMFEYDRKKSLFFSKGKILIKDVNDNEYKFSEIYINEKDKKIVGSDLRAHFNQKDFKLNEDNDPRFYSNILSLDNEDLILEKGIFTYCKNRGEDKCPPWSIQAEKIQHSSTKKTIYYSNAVLKVYDFPIFYFPKFSHPDPTVDRRSGFLVPTLLNSSNLGTGFALPYYVNLSNDRDLTLTSKLYSKENPLLLAEYRQAFKNSFLQVDAGHTEGYKKVTKKKTDGARNHLFVKYTSGILKNDEQRGSFELNLQQVSNETYFKVYDIETDLVDKENNIVENSIKFDYLFKDDSSINTSIASFEDLSKSGHKKFEYLLPSLVYNKNLISDLNFGSLDLNTNLEVKNYDVNKQTEFFVNDLIWESPMKINDFGFETQYLAKMKAVSYNADNTSKFKNENKNYEAYGALGLSAKLPMLKENKVKSFRDYFTPKFLLRYSPGHMRSIDDNYKLKYDDVFNIDRLNLIDTLESGLSASLGFEYTKNKVINNETKELFYTSFAQIINAEENNDRPAPINKKYSDLVGKTKLNISDNFDLNYNYAIDQTLNDINFSEIGMNYLNGPLQFNINYLEEKNNYGSQEYVKSELNYAIGESGKLSFSAKRDLLKSSSEFYNLSYQYINDCLRAGIAYRREFYVDKDIEAENYLMFTIDIVPFGSLSSPTFN